MIKKKQITKKTFVMTVVIGSFLIMSMVIANTFWASKKASSATDEAVSAVSSFYLDAMADRRSKTITNLINNNFDEMNKALAFIEDENVKSFEDLRITIGKIKSLLSLSRFAVVDEDNIVYTQYTTYTGRSRYEFLSAEKMEDRMINTVSVYGSSKQLCLAIPTPDFAVMGKPIKACFVQIDIRDIVDLLAFEDQGRTYFGLYNKSGENLSDTELGPVIAKQNLFEAIKGLIPEAEWKENQDNFINGNGGGITFTYDGAAETLCYVPIQGTGWEMVVLIRESIIHDQIQEISNRTIAASKNQIAFTLVSVLLLAAILLLELRIISKHKLEAEKENSRAFRNMANTDSLTGIRNKHAYSENEAILNQKIHENELKKLAVVVCDINGLKRVNDTEGHAAGDKLIRDASALICEYFNHGAVFRVGGDEFAVILQEKGYDTMADVISEFNRKIEANIAEKSVVISIGYAVLEEGDQQLRDVFERADHMMYIRKKELKEMGAPTREA